MNKRLKRGRIGRTAFAVAILVLLQALFGSFALAAKAGAPAVDAFGNALCITSTEDREPLSAPGKDRSLLPECCTLACGMALGFLPQDRDPAALFNPLAQPSQPVVHRAIATIRSALDNLPGNPRGPPTAA